MIHRTRAGFTLIELVVTVAVLALLILGVMSGTSVAMKSRTLTRERDLAREAIRTRLEAIADAPFGTVPAMTGQQFDVPNPADLPGGVTAPERLRSSVAGQLPGLVTVNSVAAPAGDYNADGQPDLVWVTVEVRWLGADGRPNRQEGGTFLANRE